MGRPPGPGMCPPPHGGRCRPLSLPERGRTRVSRRRCPGRCPHWGGEGGLALPATAALPRGSTSAGQRHPQRSCPTRGVPAPRTASLQLARCSCPCHHLAGTRGTAVRGQPGGCCHTAGVRVGGRDAGSMRDCGGGAVDRDAPELGCPRQCPPRAGPGGTGSGRVDPRGSVAPGAGPWGRRPGVRWVPGAGGRWQVSRQTGSGGCRQRTRLGAGSCARLDVSSAGGPGGWATPPLRPRVPAQRPSTRQQKCPLAWFQCFGGHGRHPEGLQPQCSPQPSGHPQGPCVPSMAPSAWGRCRDSAVGGHPLGAGDSIEMEGAVGTEPQLGMDHGCPHGTGGNSEDGWRWGAEGAGDAPEHPMPAL